VGLVYIIPDVGQCGSTMGLAGTTKVLGDDTTHVMYTIVGARSHNVPISGGVCKSMASEGRASYARSVPLGCDGPLWYRSVSYDGGGVVRNNVMVRFATTMGPM
jgi:hypothetical protein